MVKMDGLTVAVDIGGTKIAVAAIADSGIILARTEWPTLRFSPEEAVREISRSLLRCADAAGAPLRGIGIGCTGPVDPFSGTIGDVDLLPGWKGFGLVEQLSRETGLSAAMENDADAAALAEARWGAGQGASRFIYVTVSTGIGTGMVFDGKLYRGAGGFHPEAGHHTVDASGPLCYCGARGCWESLASGPALVRRMRSNATDRELPADLTARDICELARSGDGLAMSAIQKHAEYIGIGLANLVTLFCPDVIAMGGGMMQSADLFLEQANAVVRSRCGLVPTDGITIRRASLGNDAPLLGAATVWQARFGQSD